jgi:hypothetical protein
MSVMDLANGPRLTPYNLAHFQASEVVYLIGRDRWLRPRLSRAVTRLVLSLSIASHATELWSNLVKKELPRKGGNVALPWQYPIEPRCH